MFIFGLMHSFSMASTISSLKGKIIPILRRYRAKKAAVFGSYARGDAKKGSDVDLLVQLGEGISLLDFIGIKQEIEEKIGKPVDLVEYSAIKPSLRERILREQVVIL